MFPIPFNFPFRKKDGSLTSLGAAIDAGGGGTPYELPTASASTKGGVKIGNGLEMDGEVLKNTNPTPFSLPTASANTLGGVKVGSGLSIEDGVLSTNGGSGVSKIYYKEITSGNDTFQKTADISNEGSSVSYAIYKSSIIFAVSGYTPIAAIVYDVYSGYHFISDVKINNSNGNANIIVISNRDPNDGATKIRVYYIKNEDLQPLT